MSDQDRFIGQLEDYLAGFDGETPLPARVRDAVHAALPSIQQARPRPGLERMFAMLSTASAGARLGLAAAVVVAAVVLGGALINSRNAIVGGGATPSPSPSPAPSTTLAPSGTPAPSARAGIPTLQQGDGTAPCAPGATTHSCLLAGTYRLTGDSGTWPVPVTLTVPAGWFDWEAGTGWDAVLVDKGLGDTGWGVMFYAVKNVARDPCDASKGTTPAAEVATPTKLAAAMAAWPHFTSTTPRSITIDGHSGVTFELDSTSGATCTGYGAVGQSMAGATVDAYPMVNGGGTHDPATVEIVDTGHGLLVIRATDFPQAAPYQGQSPTPITHAGDLADLHAILGSVHLGSATP
jgi:hypothetical protein